MAARQRSAAGDGAAGAARAGAGRRADHYRVPRRARADAAGGAAVRVGLVANEAQAGAALDGPANRGVGSDIPCKLDPNGLADRDGFGALDLTTVGRDVRDRHGETLSFGKNEDRGKARGLAVVAIRPSGQAIQRPTSFSGGSR